jgi:saccharopine dehydrogenase-like NADP-dependent oxidoreductase
MTRPEMDASRTILVIGAAGEMCRHVIQRLTLASDAKLILADINLAPVESLISLLPQGQATSLRLDLYDHRALIDAMRNVTLVVLAAGPYMKTAKPVLAACLEAKVPYLDFDDDVESTISALDLHHKASELGVPCFIGCGKPHSPDSRRKPVSYLD